MNKRQPEQRPVIGKNVPMTANTHGDAEIACKKVMALSRAFQSLRNTKDILNPLTNAVACGLYEAVAELRGKKIVPGSLDVPDSMQ